MSAQVPKGLEYVKSIGFILKIIEFVILLIAIGTLGFFLDHASFSLRLKPLASGKTINSFDFVGRKEKLDFGMAVVVLSWLLVIGFVALFVTGLHEKVKCLHWPITVAINMAIKGIFLFIAGCVIADTARRYDEKKNDDDDYTFCGFLKSYQRDARCAHLVGTTVLCFFVTIVFGIDVFIHLRMSASGRSSDDKPAAVAT